MVPVNWKTRQTLSHARWAYLASRLRTATGANRRTLQAELIQTAKKHVAISHCIAKRTACGAVVAIAVTSCASQPSLPPSPQQALDTLLLELHTAGKISGQWKPQP